MPLIKLKKIEDRIYILKSSYIIKSIFQTHISNTIHFFYYTLSMGYPIIRNYERRILNNSQCKFSRIKDDVNKLPDLAAAPLHCRLEIPIAGKCTLSCMKFHDGQQPRSH